VKRLLAALAAALSLAAVPSPASAARAKKIKVALMEIRSLGTAANLSDLLSEVALTEVGSMDRIEAIGRSDIESILGFEKQKKVLGCSDETNCLAEVGGALGVEFIIVGTLGRVGALYRLDMKLVETAKSRVRARTGESVEGQEEKLVASVQKAIHRLLDPIANELPLPPAPTVTSTTPPVVSTPPASSSSSSSATSHTPPVTTAMLPPAAVEPAERSSSGSWSRRKTSYVVGGAGILAVAGGVVFGLSAKSAYDTEKTAAAAGDAAVYKTNRDKAKSNALLADLLYGVGAAGLGVGTWLFVSSPSSAPVTVGVAPAPNGGLLVVSGGF
jgi:hypothetical protein